MKCLVIEEGIISGFNFHPVTHIGGYYFYVHTYSRVHIVHTNKREKNTNTFQCRVHNAQALPANAGLFVPIREVPKHLINHFSCLRINRGDGKRAQQPNHP